MPGRNRKRLRSLLLINLLCTAAVLTLYLANTPPLVRAEDRWADLMMREGRKAPVNDDFLCLAVDDDSYSLEPLDLETLYRDVPRDTADFRALGLMAEGFPWSREVYALLLDKLFSAGAKAVIFDMVFLSEKEGDATFHAALDRYRDRVVLGSDFTPKIMANGRDGWIQSVPAASIIPATRPQDTRIGFVNFWGDDADGKVRSATFALTHESLNGFPYRADQQIYQSIAARALVSISHGESIPKGFDPALIRFADPGAATFQPRALMEVFVPKYWQSPHFQSGSLVAGKVVIVGAFGKRNHDVVQTPFRGEMPGPLLHLQVLNAALQGTFLQKLPLAGSLLLILLAGSLAFVANHQITRPGLQSAVLIASSGAFLGFSWLAFNWFDHLVPTVGPLVALNGGGVGSLLYQFIVERIERTRTRKQFERYMSRNVVRELLDNPEEFEEARLGVRRSVTILFSDLRGFTTLTESRNAQELVTQLNQYLTQMVDCVFRHEGTVDKFIGDAVMAVWGNVRSLGAAEDARMAIDAALEMRSRLAVLNAGWLAEGKPAFHFGIGLNYGEVITGDMGSAEKSEFTVIGDPVNLASRMEGLTKEYGVDLLIGEDVATLVSRKFLLQNIDWVRVKGKGAPTEVFAVLQPASESICDELGHYLDEFSNALQLYRNRVFLEARQHFEAALESRPGDAICETYLRRCANFIKDPPPEDWDAVFVMHSK